MKKKAIILSSILVSSMLFLGCNGEDNNSAIEVFNESVAEANSIALIESSTEYNLTAQTGTSFQLFYGNSNHTGLGSLSNVSTYAADTNTTTSQDADITSRYPAMSTTLTYSEGNYTNMYISEIGYEANSTAYSVDMTTGTKTTFDDVNVSVSHTKINYLGAKQYAIVTAADGNSSLIAPESNASASVPFTHKTLVGVTYASYGDPVNGYLVLNDHDHDYETTNQLQKCSLAMTCTDIVEFGSKTILSHGTPKAAYDMDILGDVAGTTKSLYISNNEIVELDKSNGEISVKTSVATGSTSHTLKGSEVFYVKMMNIYKTTLDGTVTQLSSNGLAMGLRAFTDDMVIFGGDTYMYAVAKDGSNKSAAIEISVATKTAGQKYPFDLGIGSQYLFTLFSVDDASGKNTFYACKLEDKKKECREDSYWSAVTAKRSGTLNNTSSYAYTPYAYIRVDATDNYGGGDIKAIDPEHPLDDGITMGSIPEFNFQSFVTSKYDDDMVDSNGSLVLYAKNDLDFRGDAFLVNLNVADSLVNLTNELAPSEGTITGTSAHCHGRMCTVCHSFSGGKIYSDATASSSANGYTIKFDFRDGSESLLALVRKGTGENFNVPLESLAGKSFKATVISTDGNDLVAAETAGYSHKGLEYFNCNFCHGRAGQLLYDAPNVINSDQ